MKKKQKKLALGLCIPAAVLGTTFGVLGAIYATRHTPDVPTPIVDGDYQLTFNSGNGRFINTVYTKQKVYANQSLDRIPQPTAVANTPGALFAGWVDQDGVEVAGAQKFTKDTTLTARYSDSIVGDYVTVTFAPGEAGVVIKGNASVAVKKGHFYYMVNRPTAEAAEKYFKGWKYQSGEKAGQAVKENDVFTTDTVLVPDFVQAVTVTWDANGGSKVRGQMTTTLEYGSLFNSFNQPQLTYDEYYFGGWYREKECVNAFLPTDPINVNTTAYAKWVSAPEPADGYARLNFVVNSTEGQPQDVYFSPSSKALTSTAAGKNTWGQLVHPNANSQSGDWAIDVDEDGKEKWEVSQSLTGTWTPLTDGSTFTDDKNVYYIRPIMTSSISEVSIQGDTTILPEVTTKYTGTAIGGNTRTLTWTAWDDEECETPCTDVTLVNDTKTQEVQVVPKSLTADKTIYLKGVSDGNTGVEAVLEINIVMPYEYPSKGYDKLVWIRLQRDSKDCWYSLDPAELCVNKTSGSYTATPLLSTAATKTISRKIAGDTPTFTQDLYVGNGITAIPDQFLIGCTNFNGNIILDEHITSIGSSFLEGCSNFNKTLDLQHITSIGSNFLYGCTKWNNGQADVGEAKPFALPDAMTSIGDNFLGYCTSFNNELTLPENEGLAIGSNFLFACTSFNQDITLPENMTAYDGFMNECVSYTSTITANCPVTNITFSKHNFSADSDSYTTSGGEEVFYPIYTTGFTFAGDNAEGFAAAYPNIANSTIAAYRKITNSSATEKPSEASWTAAKEALFGVTGASPVYRNYTLSRYYDEKPTNVQDDLYVVEDAKRLITQAGTDSIIWQVLNTGDKVAQVSDEVGLYASLIAPEDMALNITLTQIKGNGIDTAAYSDLVWDSTEHVIKHTYTDAKSNTFTAKLTLTGTGSACRISQFVIEDTDNVVVSSWSISNYGTTAFKAPDGNLINYYKLSKDDGTPSASGSVSEFIPKGQYGFAVDLSTFTSIADYDQVTITFTDSKDVPLVLTSSVWMYIGAAGVTGAGSSFVETLDEQVISVPSKGTAPATITIGLDTIPYIEGKLATTNWFTIRLRWNGVDSFDTITAKVEFSKKS